MRKEIEDALYSYAQGERLPLAVYVQNLFYVRGVIEKQRIEKIAYKHFGIPKAVLTQTLYDIGVFHII